MKKIMAIALFLCLMSTPTISAGYDWSNQQFTYTITVSTQWGWGVWRDWHDKEVGSGTFLLERRVGSDGVIFYHAVADGGANDEFKDNFGVHEHSESWFREVNGQFYPEQFQRQSIDQQDTTLMTFSYSDQRVSVDKKWWHLNYYQHSSWNFAVSEPVLDPLICFYRLFSTSTQAGQIIEMQSHSTTGMQPVIVAVDGDESLFVAGRTYQARRMVAKSLGVNIYKHLGPITFWQDLDYGMPLQFSSKIARGFHFFQATVKVTLKEVNKAPGTEGQEVKR